MKVQQFYNKNQFIIRGKDEIYFQSYNSTIAKIDKKGVLYLGHDWDYSKTTTKHLYLFLNDYIENIYHMAQYKELRELNQQTNKKQFIQKLIDNKIIKVKEL